MAIDTAEKRKSLVGINYFNGPGVTTNVLLDQEWRQQAGYGYSGILAALPGTVEEMTGDSEMINTFTADSEMINTFTADSQMVKTLIGDSEL